ncbi:hypothetical protein [Lysobacter capsici]|uniref:hypothetical protein n=1 Tax=Lysobacter capsici TaxID=435897 RepID=UPI0012FE6799|nr:hypothetical protein [Lysobacter capsici]
MSAASDGRTGAFDTPTACDCDRVDQRSLERSRHALARRDASSADRAGVRRRMRVRANREKLRRFSSRRFGSRLSRHHRRRIARDLGVRDANGRRARVRCRRRDRDDRHRGRARRLPAGVQVR